MLARANRVIRAEEFRTVVRRGRRTTTPVAVYYEMSRTADQPSRFGFIVSKAVGNAVERNLLRRRLRAIARELVDHGEQGRDVVVRARPEAGGFTWTDLRADARAALLEPVR